MDDILFYLNLMTDEQKEQVAKYCRFIYHRDLGRPNCPERGGRE